MKTIGERILAARNKKGLTRRSVGVAIGISDNALYKIENQGGSPAFTTAMLIAKVLDVDPWWLAFGDQIPTLALSAEAQAERIAMLEATIVHLTRQIEGRKEQE